VKQVFLGEIGEVLIDVVVFAHLPQRGDVVFQLLLLLADRRQGVPDLVDQVGEVGNA
jgi:hypothetical protein